MNRRNSDAMRNLVFGIEDGLVSTVGLISGIASTGVSIGLIILTGSILIVVEAFAMAVGSLLSDNSADEFEQHSTITLMRSTGGAVIMFFSYLLSGFIVLVPYLFLAPFSALPISIVLSIIALLILGAVSARFSRTSPHRKALMMAIVGGAAVVLGVLVGEFVSSLGISMV